MHTDSATIPNSLHQRFHSLIWSCLDADLTRTAVFHAERYFYATSAATTTSNAAMSLGSSSSSSEEKDKEKDISNSNNNNSISNNNTNTNYNHYHEARHLYATALMHEGQTYSALALVNGPKDEQCCGCLEIKVRCCTLLGRHRQAREAIEEMLEDKEKSYIEKASSSSRIAHPFPEEAALRCKAGTTALKGNMPEKAAQSFRHALKLNPFLWEAFEGLCALGPTPEIDDLFPPRLPPVKRLPPEEHLTSTTTTTTTTSMLPTTSRPIATGAGFFTPDTANGTGSGPGLGGGGNLFRSFKPKPDVTLPPFRMAVSGPRDSIATNDSSFYPDNSFHGHGLRHQNTRLQPPSNNINQQAAPTLSTSRPLSSADEAGPATKRLRSGGSGSGSSSSQGVDAGPGNPHLINPNSTAAPAGPGGGGPTLRPKPSLEDDNRYGQHQQQQVHAQPGQQGGSKKAVTGASSSRTHNGPIAGHAVVANANGRNANGVTGGQPAMRRSTRLQSSGGAVAGAGNGAGAGASNSIGVGKMQGTKHTTRDRRRAIVASLQQREQQHKLQQLHQGRRNNSNSKSAESDRDEDMSSILEHPHPHGHSSPPTSHSNSRSRSHSSRSPSLPPPPLPRLSSSQPPTWTQAHSQAALEEYENEVAEYVVYELVRKFAGATRKLSMFDCKGCVEELEKLPWGQQRSCMVVAMVARANYERQEYHAAERAFKTLRKIDPYRLWDMEIYSSLLWQLQKPIELSFLAQELLNISPRSPSTWISIGNLFSLQKQRSQALRSFQRAYELDAGCAYAYTLSGHEWIDEDVERAVKFFQRALRADGRHYNAWYGLGTCYLRMGKWMMAEWHFRRAVDVCPGNAVLLGCVGMAVERRGDKNEALSLFNEAVRIAPENALVRYRRAKMYISMERHDEALVDLEYLANATPDESNVIFQLAKVYRLKGDVVKSAQALAAARDVSPKSVGKIRRLVELDRVEFS